MILPALSAGTGSDSPATTLGSPLMRPGGVGCHVVQSISASVQTADSESLQEPFGRGGR
jgi:hypothetical protein